MPESFKDLVFDCALPTPAKHPHVAYQHVRVEGLEGLSLLVLLPSNQLLCKRDVAGWGPGLDCLHVAQDMDKAGKDTEFKWEPGIESVHTPPCTSTNNTRGVFRSRAVLRRHDFLRHAVLAHNPHLLRTQRQSCLALRQRVCDEGRPSFGGRAPSKGDCRMRGCARLSTW